MIEECFQSAFYGCSIFSIFMLSLMTKDENECQNNNGGCQDNCVNTVGSYICSCREGFLLQRDKHSCKEGKTFHDVILGVNGSI